MSQKNVAPAKKQAYAKPTLTKGQKLAQITAAPVSGRGTIIP